MSWALGMSMSATLQFAVAFLLGFRGHAGFVDFLAQFVDFGLRVVDFAEFFLNGFHLFAQEVFALILAYLLLNLLIYLAAKLQNFELLGEFANQHFEALAHVGGFDQFLTKQGREAGQCTGDEVGETARIVDIHGGVLQVVRKLRRMAHDVAEEVLRVALQCLEFGVFFTCEIGLGGHGGTQERAQAQQFIDADALQAFQEDDHVAVGHLNGLVDLGKRADFVEVRRSRIFDPRIQLGNHAQKLIVARKRIDQSERALTAHGER
jgi:hypothetical protein